MATITGDSANNTLTGTGSGDTITGLNGNDTINALGGDDTITAGPSAAVNTPLDLNWNGSFTGTDFFSAAGRVQDTGGISVTTRVTNDGNNGATANTDTAAVQYRDPAETFNTGSSLRLNGTGDADTSTTTISFASTSGSGFQNAVQDVVFRINDVDGLAGGWRDLITITALNGTTPVNVTMTASSGDAVTGSGTTSATVTAGLTNDSASTVGGSVLIRIPGPLTSVSIDWNNLLTTGQIIWVTDVQFSAIPVDDDLVNAGDGNDLVFGGFGNDVLNGDAGNDTLNGDAGNDTLNGGVGNDRLDGGIGNDSMTGSDGDDVFVLTDGFGTDTIVGGEAAETTGDRVDASALTSAVSVTLTGSEAGTLVNGFNSATFSQIESFILTAQADSFNGAAATGALSVDGGAGNDSLLGGSGNDTLTGGLGNDTLNGGAGADSLAGGDGDDVFMVDLGDSVDGGEGGVDTDTLDLRNWGKALTDISYDPLNHENGTVTFYDAFGGIIGTMSFQNIENVIPCFTPGTMIATDRGAVAVEKLRVGDRVLSRDNGYQALRWVGSRRIDAGQLAANPRLQPVLIGKAALGDGLPLADMIVSPQHRMLMSGPRAELLFGEAEVLASALHLTGLTGVKRLGVDQVTYLHLMFDQHEIISANGAWTESFQPGERAMAGLGADACAELFAIFPELATAEGRHNCQSARLSLKGHEVRALLAA